MAKKKDSDISKILKTIDGMFTNRPDIDKPRIVIVVDQRKDDGALAVVKVHSRKGKSGKTNIEGLVLTPDQHPSLTEESIVEKRVHIGIKIKLLQGTTYKPMYLRDLTDTGDRLTTSELKKVKKGVAGDSKKHKKSHRKKMKRWKNHFKK